MNNNINNININYNSYNINKNINKNNKIRKFYIPLNVGGLW